MKKMLAFLVAVSMCLCTFTACGDDKKEKSDAVSSSEAEPVSEEKKDEVSDEKSAESDEYADKFMEMVEAAKSDDVLAVFKCTFPDITLNAFESTESLDAIMTSIGSLSSFGFDGIDSVRTVSVEECDADITEDLEKVYSVYTNLFIVMDENNVKYADIESEQLSDEIAIKLLDPLTQLSQINDYENLSVDISVEFEEAKMVSFEYNGREEKIVAYKVKGEDWKLDTIGIDILNY